MLQIWVSPLIVLLSNCHVLLRYRTADKHDASIRPAGALYYIIIQQSSRCEKVSAIFFKVLMVAAVQFAAIFCQEDSLICQLLLYGFLVNCVTFWKSHKYWVYVVPQEINLKWNACILNKYTVIYENKKNLSFLTNILKVHLMSICTNYWPIQLLKDCDSNLFFLVGNIGMERRSVRKHWSGLSRSNQTKSVS